MACSTIGPLRDGLGADSPSPDPDALGSCAFEEKPQPIRAAVLTYRPDLFLVAGDNVYGDVRDGRAVPETEAEALSRTSRPGMFTTRCWPGR